MKRVNNAANHLVNTITEGQKYYIGFGIKQLTKLGRENSDIQDIIKKKKNSAIITGKKGVLKENTRGKYIRKEPQSKTSVMKHIEYYSNHFHRDISYDREFNIWEKELLHNYNLALTIGLTPQGETILHFPLFTMQSNEAHYQMAGAAMNIALQLGEYFLFYDTNFEPIIPITKVVDKSILPSGTNYASVKEKLDVIYQNIMEGNSIDQEGNSYRFALLKEAAPDDVTMGRGGFDDYLMFEYIKSDLIVLENLKSGNATYLFKRSKFDKNMLLDKQTARSNKAFKERVIHENMVEWNEKMGKHFS
ncbi:MAG: hypothetical protein JWQ38_2747 [Flavipsychrobacter sp.]|nr:hypothetical protein [Flavipsychrobacter sp.]